MTELSNPPRLRKITPTGVVSTFASDTRFSLARGLAVDSGGNVYVADNGSRVIRKITSDGVGSIFVGKPGARANVDGTGTAAEFSAPSGVAVDSADNLYVTDGYTIRKITPGGVVTTIAGTAGKSGYVDGSGSAARFYDPRDIAIDRANNLYVSDGRTIRKVTPDGVVSTVAGKPTLGPLDGGFARPSGVAVDKAGNIYVADADASIICKITAAGVVSTLAGKYHITDEDQER